MSEEKALKFVAQISNYDIFDKSPWVPFKEGFNSRDKYLEAIRKSRFYYREDPIIFSVINRISDIGTTRIVIDKGKLTKSEYEALQAISGYLLSYVKDAIRELLLTGLLYTEVVFEEIGVDELRTLGIPYKKSMVFPRTVFFRNPEFLHLVGASSPEDVEYIYEIPDYIVDIIDSGGESAVADIPKESARELYKKLQREAPEFVRKVKKGERFFRLQPKYRVIRLNSLSDSVYPVPYLKPVIPLLEHKRNIRRMDYALAARAILMIMHVKVGNDQYPLTKEDEEYLDELRQQMMLPGSITNIYDRIFQLFTPHVVDIDWITPPVDILLNVEKYEQINEEILMGLGFPRLVLYGESRRTQASAPDIANTIIHSMLDVIRSQIIVVIRQIINDVMIKNNFKGRPNVIRFEPMKIIRFRELFEAVRFLYESGSLSRQSLSEFAGYNFFEEVGKRYEEEQKLQEMNLPEFGPMPYSRNPDKGKRTEENR